MIFNRDKFPVKPFAAAILLGLGACSGDAGPELAPMEKAKQALAANDGMGAEIALRDMMASGVPEDEVAAFLGEAELQQGQLAEARQWLGKGQFSADTRAHGFYVLGKLEMRENNLPAAGKAFDESLRVNENNAELWVSIGRLRYLGGEQLQAANASLKAIEVNPKSSAALQFRAQLARDSAGMKAGLEWFEKALEVNPDNTILLYEYAATLGELGQARKMLETIRKIAKLDPDNRRIYYLQAVLAARASKFELARLLLSRADKETQDMPAAILLSGIIDIENGNYASATQELQSLAEKQPANKRVRDILARALSLDGNDSELVYRYAEEARRPDASPYLKTLVARAYERLDKRAEAAVLLDDVANGSKYELTPVGASGSLDVLESRGVSSGQDSFNLIRARISSGNSGAAVSAAQQFVARFPGSFDALSLAGDASLAAQRYSDAVQYYAKAGSIRRPWILARKMAIALRFNGQKQESVRLLAQYFVSDQINIEAAELLAREAAKDGDWDAAAIFADHALTNGGDRTPGLLILRSQVALGQGDKKLALQLAKRAYAIVPLSLNATIQLADVYRKMEGGMKFAQVLDAKIQRMKS